MHTKAPIIRAIAQRDNAALAGIIRSVLTEFGAAREGTVFYDPTTDDLYSLFGTPSSSYVVAEQDGIVNGGCGIFPTSGLPHGYCELVKLYLLPEARGYGTGKELINQCINTAKETGYTHMYLETMPELNMAVGLYESCGFRYLPAPMGASGHYGCNIWMLKDL